MTLGKRLRDLRLNARKTLQDQSKAFGVSVNTIYRWEHNMSIPHKRNLANMARFYGIEFDWLLSGQGNSNGNKKDILFPNFNAGDLAAENSLEEQLIRMYITLPENSKCKILGYVERMCLEDMGNYLIENNFGNNKGDGACTGEE